MTRKLKFMIPFLMMAMTTFTGCSGSDDNDGTPSGEVLSAEQSKEKLSEIGQKLIQLVNANDQKQLAKVGNYFTDIVGSFEMEESSQASQMVHSLVAASQGDMSSVYAMAATNSEIYQISDYYGIYTYNTTTRKWDRTKSTSEFTWKFTYENQPVEIKMVASGNTTDFTYDGETVKVPATVTATIKQGSTTLTSVVITAENIVSSSPRKADIRVNIDANGYQMATFISATPQVVKANYSMTIKGTETMRGEVYMNGSNMTADQGSNENVVNRFHDAQMVVNVMGEAAITLQCSSYKEFAREMEQVADRYDNMANQWGQSQEGAEAMTNVCKKYMSGNLAFGGSEVPSATLTFQPYIEYSSPGESGTAEYWETETLLLFEDQSLISFDNYFDAASGPFKKVADSFKALVRSFEGILD